MKFSEKQAALAIGACCLGVFTALLTAHLINADMYAALIVVAGAFSLIVAVLPRVQEFTLKLGEAKVVLDKIDRAKAELAQVYGGIEHLKRAPLVLDNNKIAELGLSPHHLPSTTGPMWYTAGVVKQERERLARIFVVEKTPEKIAEAILDASLDLLVFKYDGPEVPLNAPPKSAEQRRIERGSPF